MKIVKISLIFFLMLVLYIQPIYAEDSKLVLTHDKSVNDKWFRVRSEDIPFLVSVNQVFQGQDLLILLFFMQPGINANGEAKIYYDFKVTHPDGEILLEQKHVKVIDARILNKKTVRLSESIPIISLRKEPGRYLVQVEVQDEVARTIQHHQQEIELMEYVYERYFQDENTYNIWMKGYYNNPTPEKLLDGLIFFSNLDSKIRTKAYPAAWGFYSKALNDNPYLITNLLKLYSAQSNDTKMMILSLLPYLEYDHSSFINQLNENEKRFYTAWQSRYLKYPVEGIQTKSIKFEDTVMIGSKLDMLWGTFFASGEYIHIKKLVEVLELAQYSGYFNQFKESKNTMLEEKAALDLVYQTVKWSIDSNYRQHKLVRDYCNFIYDNEELSPWVRQELMKILGRK